MSDNPFNKIIEVKPSYLFVHHDYKPSFIFGLHYINTPSYSAHVSYFHFESSYFKCPISIYGTIFFYHNWILSHTYVLNPTINWTVSLTHEVPFDYLKISKKSIRTHVVNRREDIL